MMPSLTANAIAIITASSSSRIIARASSTSTKVINFCINAIFDTPSAHCAHGQERISAQRISAHWALVWLADWSGEDPTMAGLLGYGERLDGVSVRRARVWRAVFSCLPIM